GVVNRDFGYVYDIDQFECINGVCEASKYFINLGYEVIVITNQSGLGRNYYTKDDFIKLTN
ncbi:D,D-heptose 1,7-bisphosphate phosphatase, partial [Aliarcobacter butzleri]